MTAQPDKYKTIFKDDCLSIETDVKEFANLITQDKTARVYSISAKFGIGKSFFCDKLKRVLSANGVTNAIFNVWESDFYEDPIIPILSELNALYQHKNKDRSLPTDIVNHRSLWKILASALKINGKLVVPGFGEFGAEINGQNAVAECNRQDNEKTASIYDEYLAYKTALDNLRKALKDWTRRKRKPVVLIIDELDRCRPDYAVKTLEVIKHFFNIDGLVFVLAIDEEQLENSVRCLFGTTDFDGYKRKFISNAFKMAEPDNMKFAEMLYDRSGIANVVEKFHATRHDILFPNTTELYINPMNSGYQIYTDGYHASGYEWPQSRQIITHYFAAFSSKEMFNFSLRKQEQVFDRIVLFAQSLNHSQYFSPDLVVFLACLHEYNKELFYKFKEYKKNSSVPYKDFSIELDAINPNPKDSGTNRFAKGWEKTKIIRQELLFGFLKGSKDKYNQWVFNGEPVQRDKLNLFFDYANNNQRMDKYGWPNFDTRRFVEEYFSKMEFVSRFSDQEITTSEE